MSIKQRSLGTMSSAARGILITGGTNATPIVATITAGHRLKNGDRIAIAGVTTLTTMNGEFSVDTVAATTLNLTGSAATAPSAARRWLRCCAIARRSIRATRRSR
jgi:hypothetical protein